MKKRIEAFLNYELPKLINSDSIYNEFSLQHELGIYLRANMPDYKVQFERNATYLGINDTVKHEIDIAVFKEKDKGERYAIELKYPKNGQYPEQMYQFIKDIKFMEEVKDAGFAETYCITLVDDPKFYSNNKGYKTEGIYQYFRVGSSGTINLPSTTISKPTGVTGATSSIKLNVAHAVKWERLTGHMSNSNYRYYFCVI